MKESENDIPMGSVPIIIGFNGSATRAVTAHEVVSQWLDELLIKDPETRNRYRSMVYHMAETTTLDVEQAMNMIERIINLDSQTYQSPEIERMPIYAPEMKEIVSVSFENVPDVKSFGVKVRSNRKKKR